MIDPTELVKGLCRCLDVDYNDVFEIKIDPHDISIKHWNRGEDGKRIAASTTKNIAWRDMWLGK